MCKLWGMGIKNNRFAILDMYNFKMRICPNGHDLLRISRSLTTVYMFFGEKVYKMFLVFLFQNLNHIYRSLPYFATKVNGVKSFVSGLI
jgi:hypothetical protein